MKKTILFVGLTLPLLTFAETLFFCKTTTSKQIKVEKQGNIVSYTFGKNLQQPELAMKKLAKDVVINNELFANGVTEQYIDIPNDGYHYQVTNGNYYEFDDQHRRAWYQKATLVVSKGKKPLAELKCIESTIKPNGI